jgi:hypothetical protein
MRHLYDRALGQFIPAGKRCFSVGSREFLKPGRVSSLETAHSMRGDYFMHPRIHLELTPAEQASVATWTRRMLIAYGFVAMALLAPALLLQASERDTSALGQARSPAMAENTGAATP